jgi:hypothetical protein
MLPNSIERCYPTAGRLSQARNAYNTDTIKLIARDEHIKQPNWFLHPFPLTHEVIHSVCHCHPLLRGSFGDCFVVGMESLGAGRDYAIAVNGNFRDVIGDGFIRGTGGDW